MAQVAQAPAYGGLRQTSFDKPRSSSQDEEEVVSVRCAASSGTGHPVFWSAGLPPSQK